MDIDIDINIYLYNMYCCGSKIVICESFLFLFYYVDFGD